MPSSTSSSSWGRADRALVALGVCLVTVLAGLELSMRLVLPSISNTERRVLAARAAARTIPATDAQGRRTILIVGNSLLMQGIDPSALQRTLGDLAGVTVFPVEGTTYLDWYFGLRRLQADGARPAITILCMNARQLASNSTQGESFAHEFMLRQDLPLVAEEAGLDLTTRSAFFFASYSAWLGKRQGLRNGILDMWLPNASALATAFTATSPATGGERSVDVQQAAQRLVTLDGQVRQHGGRFVWLVPPSANPQDPAPAIAAAARERGIRVAIPFAPGEMPASHFQDGFHLAPAGMDVFTARSAAMLKEWL
jgi:hypothetical protein